MSLEENFNLFITFIFYDLEVFGFLKPAGYSSHKRTGPYPCVRKYLCGTCRPHYGVRRNIFVASSFRLTLLTLSSTRSLVYPFAVH